MKDFLCSKKGNNVLLVVIAVIAYVILHAGFGLGGAIGGAIAGAIGAVVAMTLKAVLKPAETENDTPTANHVKHGASSKSHTSRRNFIGTLCCLLLALCVGFPACGDDDGDKDNIKSSDIVGKWQPIETTFNPSDQNTYHVCELDGSWIEFKNNGTFEEFSPCDDDTWTGTWKLEGKNLTMEYNNFPFEIPFSSYTVVSVSANELVLSVTVGTVTITTRSKRL